MSKYPFTCPKCGSHKVTEDDDYAECVYEN